MTMEKVAAYATANNLQNLQGEARLKAMRGLADRLNALSPEERRRARAGRIWESWFADMTDSEKGLFIEWTAPAGFKQMLDAFTAMPEERRRKAINDAMVRLREEEARFATDQGSVLDTNAPPPLSPELQEKITTIGLKTFYSSSSAQTKAELAPVLEELQRLMESGAAFRGPRRP